MCIVRTATVWSAALWRAALCLVVIGAAVPALAANGEQVWLRGAGATFPAPLYKKWIEGYHAANPMVSLTYDAVGSGEGISRFVTGSVDFAGSDVRMGDKEAAQLKNGVVMLPGAAGMIVLAYNLPEIAGQELRLTRDVYVAIFAGKITLWDDARIQAANPGLTLPHRNIALVARQDSSGTTAAFTSHLAAISPNWREAGLGVGKLIDWPASAMLVRGNEGVSARIKISDGAIGYVEYGFAKRLGLAMASLQNKSDAFIRPLETAGEQALAAAAAKPAADERFVVTDPDGAGAYPIVTYSWLLLYKKYSMAAKGAEMTKFVSWGLTDGQRFASDLGYVPLPPEAVTLSKQLLGDLLY